MTEIDRPYEEGLRDRLVSLTRDLVLIPSCVTEPREIERGMEFIGNHLDSIPGVRIQRFNYEESPSLLALPNGVEEPDVLLCGHLDVIAHEDLGVYRSTLADGRIYGPGAGDMKGELAILMELFHKLHHVHKGLSLGLLITSDEEQGGMKGVRHLFEDVGFRCGLAILPDGGSVHEVTVEEKGILHLRIQRENHGGHAAWPWLSDNPMEDLIQRLSQLCQSFSKFQNEPSDDRWHPTVSVTSVYTPNRTINRIPSHAEATLDVRFPPPWTVETMIAEVRRILGEKIDATLLIADEPSNLSPDTLFLEIAEKLTGSSVELVRSPGGSDARFICRYGIPVIVSRPSVGNIHAIDEWIDIESMETFYHILNRYIISKLTG